MIARIRKFFTRPVFAGRPQPSPFDFWLATVRRDLADRFTRPLSDAEWADLAVWFPKLGKLYQRGILTEGEVARKYRAERA